MKYNRFFFRLNSFKKEGVFVTSSLQMDENLKRRIVLE
ncbi:MAG: hypothetical protein BSOLF_0938 [Candidatus Carbobacillus altaicus]|uniref:Uncharacterized protein n=1 Tax=Candidatus Carbonibacillus altaicus TaxID=2163959 RepID=A0A2R6Y515_9BACL|nr:MAG: hypothetical protein BSOLF_0938 [Candidatus Carbobacillus altaicus]